MPFDLGLITQATDARGIVTDFTYDVLSRMSTKSYPASAAENITFGYDATAGGNFGTSRLTSMSDESGSTAWAYDARGNIVFETRIAGTQSYTTSYIYDAADNITQVTYPSGRIVTQTYDAIGNVATVDTQEHGAAPIVSVVSNIARQPMSQIVQAMDFGNGLDLSNTFQQDYHINVLQLNDGATSLINRSHARADLVNLTGITDAVDPAQNQSYAYSANNWLESADGPWDDSLTFGYDATGNRTTRVEDPAHGKTNTYNHIYDAASNRLLQIKKGNKLEASFAYDGAGNTLSRTDGNTTMTYSYNNAGRMAGAARTGAGLRFGMRQEETHRLY